MVGYEVRAIYEDQSGDLWIGTNHGLNCLNRETDTYTNWSSIAVSGDTIETRGNGNRVRCCKGIGL